MHYWVRIDQHLRRRFFVFLWYTSDALVTHKCFAIELHSGKLLINVFLDSDDLLQSHLLFWLLDSLILFHWRRTFLNHDALSLAGIVVDIEARRTDVEGRLVWVECLIKLETARSSSTFFSCVVKKGSKSFFLNSDSFVILVDIAGATL